MEYKIPTWKGHVITLFGREADDWKIRMAVFRKLLYFFLVSFQRLDQLGRK
jgi:hypothetical protein